MPPPLILDPVTLDLTQVVADRDAIRAINPQRFEMEQLDAIVYLNHEQQIVVGYKDVRDDEFWCRGHMPGMPLLPGVLMCEAAAQMASYYAVTQKVIEAGGILGFGGLEEVRFRGMVKPGDRFVLICKGERLKARQSIFKVQGFVGTKMVFEATVIGVPLVRGEQPGS
ncbi:MAG: 3-hydroxyacyl-ACP dehydratase FabZ family protein [Gemmataceae bacterium]